MFVLPLCGKEKLGSMGSLLRRCRTKYNSDCLCGSLKMNHQQISQFNSYASNM